MKAYFWNLLISIDQFIAVLFSPILNRLISGKHKFGDPDETISSVLGKNVKDNSCFVCKGICKILNIFQKGHCLDSIEDDEGLRK